jgi:hypothetical protein
VSYGYLDKLRQCLPNQNPHNHHNFMLDNKRQSHQRYDVAVVAASSVASLASAMMMPLPWLRLPINDIPWIIPDNSDYAAMKHNVDGWVKRLQSPSPIAADRSVRLLIEGECCDLGAIDWTGIIMRDDDKIGEDGSGKMAIASLLALASYSHDQYPYVYHIRHESKFSLHQIRLVYYRITFVRVLFAVPH